MSVANRTPVWLLTGWLGSGKTSLLKAWLRAPALADAALIINELGEVGLDDKLVAGAVDAWPAAITNACICCTGLPGLEEALSDMFWDRLHRKRPVFSSVVVETTGLADPGPVVELFDRVELLRERYRLAGVISCVSASAGARVLDAHAEASAQVAAADLLIVTKTDIADGDALVAPLRQANPRAAIGMSSRASLAWDAVRELLAHGADAHAGHPPHDHVHEHAHGHANGQAHGHHHTHASAEFVALDNPLSPAALHEQVAHAMRAGRLLRLKGVVRTDTGALLEVQWSAGDAQAMLSAWPSMAGIPRLGLTCIYQP